MVSYMSIPQLKVTIDSVEMDNKFQNVNVIRRECGFDTATLLISNYESKQWTANISSGDSIDIEVKDASDASWTKIFSGIIKTALPGIAMETGALLKLKCYGAGYGFVETVCGEEYGTQSTHFGLDTIAEILTDATYGVVPKWVEKILGGATDTGYSYDTSNVETITGTIKYVYFPFKPNNKVLDDLCDLVTAVKAGSAGPHWRVGVDDKLRVKLISATQTGWTKYYGDSQANATLEQGKDFVNYAFQELDEEANYILYEGALRKPATEILTENNSGDWSVDGNYDVTEPAASDEGTIVKVGSYSLKLSTGDGAGPGSINAWYPYTKGAAWDMEKWGGQYTIPTLSFFVRKTSNIGAEGVKIHTDNLNYLTYYWTLGTADKWYLLNLPIGPYYKQHTTDDNVTASPNGTVDWSDIDYITFYAMNSDGNVASIYIDDLRFSGTVIRGAKNSTKITNNKLKLKVITDDVGKDDSGKAYDDSGTIAQLAYMELLRAQTTPLVATFQIPMLKDLLPGQYLHVHAEKQSGGSFRVDKDMRVTKLEHRISNQGQGFRTAIYITDDLLNSHPRKRFDDLNKVLKSMRPEWQDRQATNIKAREIDITQDVLEKDYPS